MKNPRASAPRTSRRRVGLVLAAAAVVLLTLIGITVSTRPLTEITMPTRHASVAIHGYDPVSYFEGTPREGKSDLTFTWNGAQWRFASADHRDRFTASPERFAPAFDGNCAFAMSLGKVADGSPTSWVIQNGRLYLQQNAVARFLFRVLPGRAAKAEENWARIRRT